MPTLEFILKGIRGTGKTLGLSDGANTYGLLCNTGRTTNPGFTGVGINDYDKDIGEQGTGSWQNGTSYRIGITHDSTKSGIRSEISLTITYVIKY